MQPMTIMAGLVAVTSTLVVGLTGWTLISVTDMQADVAVLKDDVEELSSRRPVTRSQVDAMLDVIHLRIDNQELRVETLAARVEAAEEDFRSR